MNIIDFANDIINGKRILRNSEESNDINKLLKNASLDDILKGADLLRKHFSGEKIDTCTIISGKSVSTCTLILSTCLHIIIQTVMYMVYWTTRLFLHRLRQMRLPV